MFWTYQVQPKFYSKWNSYESNIIWITWKSSLDWYISYFRKLTFMIIFIWSILYLHVCRLECDFVSKKGTLKGDDKIIRKIEFLGWIICKKIEEWNEYLNANYIASSYSFFNIKKIKIYWRIELIWYAAHCKHNLEEKIRKQRVQIGERKYNFYML